MLNVLCLKHGIKYSADYVNKLFNMVSRHLTVPHRFFCFTEDPQGLDPAIHVKTLPVKKLELNGWWWKPYLFSQGLFVDGDVNLFFDLDTVIVNNIDKLVTHEPGRFLALRNVNRVFRPNQRKIGSAVMRWPANEYTDIWNMLENNITKTRDFSGDQDWIWHVRGRDLAHFPDAWIRSYKWEIRNKTELQGVKETCRFVDVRDPAIPAECSVLAFHGFPRIDQVLDPVIIRNWR